MEAGEAALRNSQNRNLVFPTPAAREKWLREAGQSRLPDERDEFPGSREVIRVLDGRKSAGKGGRPLVYIDGVRVKDARSRLLLSQAAFGRICGRVSADAIGMIETLNRTSEKTLQKVAKYLKINPKDLRKNHPL
jgi:hypothetical protein